MRFCPYCGQPLSDNLSKCTKCGAVLSAESSTSPFQCSKCGGILKGTETHCPWCGFPCSFKHIEETEAYQVLKSLENALREFIQEKLTSVDENWWETRVPEEVRKEASRRKSKDERLYPWHVQNDLPLIYYVDFSDYAKIIVLDKNWNQVFQRFFKDKLFIVTKLRELEPIRSAIAHMREVSEKDLQKLKLYSEEIMACMQPIIESSAKQDSLYSEVMAKVDIEHGELRIRYSESDPDTLQIEFERGKTVDVVRPKPVFGETPFPSEDRKDIEENIRELLQLIATSKRVQDGMEILQMGNLSTVIDKVGLLMYNLFPMVIREQINKMSPGSLITLVLDNKVVGLPWELAYDGTDHLGIKFGTGRIIYNGSGPLRRRKSMQRTRVLLISNPDGSLPHTDSKVALPLKEKMQRFGAVVDHFSEARDRRSPFYTSKGNILAALETGLYDIVHFIGHGGYSSLHPEESSFKVADGYLSAVDISKAFDHAIDSGKDLPFLFYAHSCEAGAQRSWDMKDFGSQVLGLSTAFLTHNVAYVGALWSASVLGADILALTFYDELLDRKQPLGLALRNAKIAVKNLHNPTCDWANFILYGDPSLTIRI
ncbi:MAG: CHAT domain-containing protein [Candidatus Bathyarchaeia archaeon]